MKKDNPEYIKLGMLAYFFDIDPLTVFMLIRKGELPSPDRDGSSWIFSRKEISEWLRNRD